jgi:hypothetical protein
MGNLLVAPSRSISREHSQADLAHTGQCCSLIAPMGLTRAVVAREVIRSRPSFALSGSPAKTQLCNSPSSVTRSSAHVASEGNDDQPAITRVFRYNLPRAVADLSVECPNTERWCSQWLLRDISNRTHLIGSPAA